MLLDGQFTAGQEVTVDTEDGHLAFHPSAKPVTVS
jgi:hypothetical protein